MHIDRAKSQSSSCISVTQCIESMVSLTFIGMTSPQSLGYVDVSTRYWMFREEIPLLKCAHVSLFHPEQTYCVFLLLFERLFHETINPKPSGNGYVHEAHSLRCT